jgi:signal transduction histidine kinase
VGALSLRGRLALALGAVVLLAILSLLIPLVVSVRDRVDADVRSQARSQAEVIAASVPGNRNLDALVRRAAATARGRVIVVNARGRLVADSAGDRLVGDVYADRPEIAAALTGRAVQEERDSATLGERLLATAVPVVRVGRPAGAVRITQSVEAVHRAVGRATLGLALVGLAVLLLGLGAAALIARSVSRPLLRLDDAARRVGAGDLTVRAAEEGSGEQRRLARSFNEMTERLDRLLRGQREFVGDASHQLRTPVTGVRLRVEEARAATADPEVQADLDAALDELDRLAQIVTELLVLSQAGERDAPAEAVDLAEAARRAAERWEAPAAERGARIIARMVDGAGRPVRSARADVDRILDVLLENAIAYGPDGQEIRLAADPGVLTVEDEGPGLAAGEEDTVLERFHRGSAARGGVPGTGLGLAIATELARRWDGDVELVNRPGGGARAAVTLPFDGS